MKIRKLIRIFHRDLGYFIVGMTIVYVVSGILLNHRHDFNPDYKIYTENFSFDAKNGEVAEEATLRTIIDELPYNLKYKKHYLSSDGTIKVFIESGEVILDPQTGKGVMRYLERRPVFFEMNKLHKAMIGSTWKWVSDLMAFILLFVAMTGLFILKGKRGFIRWGLWWMIAGFIVPLTFALIFV